MSIINTENIFRQKRRVLVGTLLLVFLLVVSKQHSFAQDEQETLDIEVTTSACSSPAEKDGKISIEVFGNSPFLYMLYDTPPWQNGTILRQGSEIYENHISLDNLAKGKYYLMVQDADKRISAKNIEVD